MTYPRINLKTVSENLARGVFLFCNSILRLYYFWALL